MDFWELRRLASICFWEVGIGDSGSSMEQEGEGITGVVFVSYWMRWERNFGWWGMREWKRCCEKVSASGFRATNWTQHQAA